MQRVAAALPEADPAEMVLWPVTPPSLGRRADPTGSAWQLEEEAVAEVSDTRQHPGVAQLPTLFLFIAFCNLVQREV